MPGSQPSSNGPLRDQSENSDKPEFGPPEYLGYRVIKELFERSDQPISWSKYWKLCCLVDRYLVEELNHDIGFPRHWYKYGETADVHSLNRGYLQAPSARFWEGQEVLPDREIPDGEFDITDEDKLLILKAVDNTLNEFADYSTEELKKYQYTNLSPNEFIERYSELRGLFEAVDLNYQTLISDFSPEDEEDYIEEQLNQMLRVFPEKYTEVHDLYLVWDDTMRLMMDHGADAMELKQFLDTFIVRLSEIILRFEEANSIPEKRRTRWVEEKPEKISQLKEAIDEKRRRYLKRHEPTGALDSISDAYDDSIVSEL